MSKHIIAVLAVVGATVVNVWLGRLTTIPNWALAMTWVGCYLGIALIYWWPRWKAAWSSFVADPSQRDGTNSTKLNIHLESEFQGEIGTIAVQNFGPTGVFAAQTMWAAAGGDPGYPISVRWRDFDGDKREIIKGQTQHLQFLRAISHPTSVGEVTLLSPRNEHLIHPRWLVDGEILQELLFLTIHISNDAGQKASLSVYVNLAAARNRIVREVVIQRMY